MNGKPNPGSRKSNGTAHLALDFRTVFESVPGHCLIVLPDDPSFTIVTASDMYLEGAGKQREELVGKSLFEVFPGGPDPSHARTMDALRNSLGRVLATRKPDTLPVQRYDLPRPDTRRDGLEERHWRPTNLPVLNGSGDVQCIIHCVEDVTEKVCGDRAKDELAQRSQELALEKALTYERERTALVLRESEEQFRLMADVMPQIVWTVNAEGQTEFFNRQWSEYTGLEYEPTSAAEIAARFVHADDISRTVDAFEEARRAGRPFVVEHRIRSAEGSYRWFLVRADPYRDPQTGEIVRWFGTSTDIHDHKQNEAALRESEERLRHALEIDTVGVIFFNPDGDIHHGNDAFLRMAGFNREDLPLRWENLTPEEWVPASRETARQLATTGRATPYEKEYLRKDGSRRWGLFAPRMLDEGEAVEFILDITQRKQTENEREQLHRALDLRAAELEAILASLPDALYIGDRGGIHRVNQLALEQLGFLNLDELKADIAILGEAIRTRDPRTGERLRADEEPFVRALQGESVTREVATTHRVTGQEVVVRCSARPIVLNGRILGAVAINSDITEEKRIEAALARQADELTRSNEDLQQFAQVAAHDLQTPLRMIRSYSQLLQRRYQGKLDDTADEFISIIMGGVDTMSELTQGLLQLAEAGGADSRERTDIKLESVVKAVLANLQGEIEETGTVVNCGTLPTLVADRLQLLQLFQNLIDNALKYRHPERPPRIGITAQPQEGVYYFEVSDNGLGIEPKHHDRIFAPLKRLHGKEISGTGIGLAVCKKIVERHGGHIYVKSEPDQGSTFCFTLAKL